MKRPSFELPALRRPPQYGAYLWWPEEGSDWIHPEDIESATELIPSSRVFCRRDDKSPYSLLNYGKTAIRVKPTLWYEITSDGFELGDLVEVKSHMGKLKPLIATIADIFWNRHHQRIDYYLNSAGRKLLKTYRIDELQPVKMPSQPMPTRQLGMCFKSKIG